MKKTTQSSIGFIFLHGAGLGAWIWADLIKKIEYPCLAIDFPGRGKHKNIAIKGLSINKYPCRQDRLGFFQHKQTASISASTPKMDCNV